MSEPNWRYCVQRYYAHLSLHYAYATHLYTFGPNATVETYAVPACASVLAVTANDS